MTKPAAIENIYPLSPLQSGLLFHTLLEPNSGVYFEQLTCELHGVLDEDAFARAWQLLVDRHPILRTAFISKGQREPVQVVHRKLSLPWRKEDWRTIDPSLQEEKLAAYLEEDRLRGFEMNRAPLMRIVTIQRSDTLWQLISSHHHILLDGWSFPLLLREFGEAYRAYSSNDNPVLVPARPFSTYLEWLRRRNPAKSEEFWRKQLAGFSAPTPLPFDNAKPKEKQYREFSLMLSDTETSKLQGKARESRITLNTLIQGAYALVLSRCSRSDDVVFGVTVAGRPPEIADVENIVGLFINTIPLRVRVPLNVDAVSWLQDLQTQQLAIQEYEHTALADIQRWSEVPRGQALFESLLVFENYPVDESLPNQLGNLQPRAVSFREHSNFPLTVIAIPGERFALRASFDTGRFDVSAIENLLKHVVHTALNLCEPRVKLGSLSILLSAEKSLLLAGVQDMPSNLFTFENLHAWFSQRVVDSPDSVAVVADGRQVTYRELDASSNCLARRLIDAGVKPTGRVGILLERSPELIVAILGILKAGGAYLPLDPIYPDDRLEYMVEDSGIGVVVTEPSLASRVGRSSAIPLLIDAEENVSSKPVVVSISPEYPAYVIYTSGSTGRPKGCVITHANVLRLLQSTEPWFQFDPSDVWTFFHSAAFDFSVWEIWGALLYGGKLVVVPYYTSREPEAFYELLVRERVTVLNQTPSAFRQFMHVEADQPHRTALSLRCVIFGGEALDLVMLRPWFARHGDQRPRLINMYGITETTVHVTYRPLLERDALEARGSLIGRPLPDLRLIVLDTAGQLAATGVAGELFVAGLGLAPGYLHRPELTAERFVPDPFGLSADGRLYRTGDLARRLPDGDFEYLGRVDDQVKIRGFRIELGEIETELSSHPDLRATTVIARRDGAGEDRLTAYVVSNRDVRPSIEDLRGWLRVRLPEYMVPASIVWMEALPLTPNGKIDRKALPEPFASESDSAIEYLGPRNEEESTLADIWREVLGVARVGIRDNYFSLGGDSIRSLAIRSRARDKGIEFSLRELFEKQTIEALLAPKAATNPASSSESWPHAAILSDFSGRTSESGE